MAEREGGVMNKEIWHKIFKDYIDCDKAITTLFRKGVIDEEEQIELHIKLQAEIIETFKGEVE